MIRIWPEIAAVPLLLALLTWMAFRGMAVDVTSAERGQRDLDDFALAESILYRDVLAARGGLLDNYDPLVTEVQRLRAVPERLRTNEMIDGELVDRLAALVDQREELVERFKAQNAVLRNSLAYVALLSERFSEVRGGGRIASEVGALSGAILRLALDSSSDNAAEVARRLETLADLPRVTAVAVSVEALLMHGHLLHELLPRADGVLRALVRLSSESDRNRISSALGQGMAEAEATAQRFRLLLFGTSLILLSLLVNLTIRLRARARLIRRRTAFERLITVISTRFVACPPEDIARQIEEALGQLAEWVGADRAYLLPADSLPQVYRWHRHGVGFAAGWPEGAFRLSDGVGHDENGIVVLDRAHLHGLADAGRLAVPPDLQRWLCVPQRSAGRVRAILGFDGVVAGALADPPEGNLLHVAMDVLVNAAERETLETEREELETRLQRARRMETIGALASGVAHNFNNITGAILGHVEMAESKPQMKDRQAHLDEIRYATGRARDLVDQILAFGRRGGSLRQPVDMHDLVDESVLLLRASLPGTVSLIVTKTIEPTVVLGEAAQLQQIIVNLCRNASEAMDGDGRVTLDMKRREVAQARTLLLGSLSPGRYVRIRVADSGRGMDDDTLSRVFEPFFTTRSAGSGLGLATVREIVEEHAGALDVRSRIGQGSRFDVWLPCLMPANALADSGSLPKGHGETILLIDRDGRRLLRHEDILAALGYEPIGYSDMSDAQAACRGEPRRFDAILVSLTNLLADIESIGTLHADLPHIPIVAAATAIEQIHRDRARSAGILNIVSLPLFPRDIARALAPLLVAPRLSDATPVDQATTRPSRHT
ncbi:two-component system VirA-like sensor kinase [Marinivivus vitaminiproducens]|uniref:two-component system VirA-like sensor kinase n=1 Tax=Marinivivus vitaminiproducens TaxID=3035935 RepID=UPI00279FD88C|nr:two-component system VirA-like sensor kinase [Geminicoccaceae bacterium SCSIO 64248]